MAEYVITPEKNAQPAGTRLLDELHRRGFPVEITLKGPDNGWENIRFFEAGPPPAECQVAFDAPSGTYKVTISRDASPASLELQLFLVETLLREVGGVADHAVTRERLNLGQLTEKLRAHRSDERKASDWLWVAFAWLVAAGALVGFWRMPGPNRWTVLVVLLFAALSACGLTYSHLKRE